MARLVAEPGQRDLVRAAYLDPPLDAAARRYHASPEWQAVRAFLPSTPGTALDLGAGNGIASHALASDGWEVLALEPDPSLTVGAGAIRALAATESLPIAVLDGQGEAIPLPDASVDLVFARQVLHHARDLPRLCREVSRVLRPGGTLLALRDHVVSSERQLKAFLASHPLHRYYGGEHAYRRDQYLRAIRDAGMEVTHVLDSFDSVINYAPHTPDSLVKELTRRVPGGWLLERPLASASARDLVCRTLSLLDFRPGRLLSVVARRP